MSVRSVFALPLPDFRKTGWQGYFPNALLPHLQLPPAKFLRGLDGWQSSLGQCSQWWDFNDGRNISP